DRSRRFRARLAVARPSGSRPTPGVVHHLPLPLSSGVAARSLVRATVSPVDRERDGSLAKRSASRPRPPSEPPTDRDDAGARHRRPAPSRPQAVVAPPAQEILTQKRSLAVSF